MNPRRTWLSLFAMAALDARAASKLANTTVDPSRARLTREPFGELRIFFDGSTDQLKGMTAGSLLLRAGMSPHPPHAHSEEEFLLVTEGTGEISIEGEVTRVGPGSLMYCAANREHGIVNTGQRPLLFYFFKWQG